jgi:hypothetical protein
MSTWEPNSLAIGTRDAPRRALERIRQAQRLRDRSHTEAWATLDTLFCAGQPPDPPMEGAYKGELVALRIAPGLTPLFERLAAWWMPWLGKTFDAGRAEGDNLFSNDSLWLVRVTLPFYRHVWKDGPRQYHAFRFRTSVGPGKFDSDRAVLRIDYDLPENPSVNVRRVLDELVQVDEGLYLGKAHFQWWWGRWSTVAFFMLRR